MSNSANISFKLHPKQGVALETEATEVLYGGAAGGGKSWVMRVAAIMWCGMIPGLQVYLFRRLRDDLIKNHVEGPQGLRMMLAPWTRAGQVSIVEDEIRFWNGSKIYLCHCKDEKDRFKYLGAEIHVLCCEENERVLLSNGETRAVRDVRVGDSVQTLQGPRPVTWVGERARKPCVRARVSVNGTNLEQIHSDTHKILTPNGWLSYADICQGLSSSVLEPTQSDCVRISPELISRQRPSALPLPDSLSLDLPPLRECDRSLGDRRGEKGSVEYTGSEGRGSDYGLSAHGILEELPSSSGFSFPVVIHERPRDQAVAASRPASQLGAWPCAPNACTPPDSQSGCQPSSCCDDEYLRCHAGSSHDAVRKQGDAEGRSPKSSPWDVQGTAPGHTLCKSLRYFHPYTGEQRTAEEPVRLGTCVLEPCGDKWTIDLTIEGENHYITDGGLVNQNCIDELTTFTDTIYRFLRGRVRMAGIEVPDALKGKFPRILASSNPGNIGHQFVKAAFIDPRPPLDIQRMPNSEGGMWRQYIPAKLSDNPALDPDEYVGRLEGLGNPALVKAMRDGDWNVVAGAYFPEFSTERHVVRPQSLPRYWHRFRSFDWGSARPFAVHWWAVSDGELPEFPRGALICYREWYGAPKDDNGLTVPNHGLRLTADEVADGITQREERDVPAGKIMSGVADPSIFAQDGGPSIADRMAARKVFWRAADNTRVARHGAMGGWDQVRARLKGDGEVPGILFFDTCLDTIRTLPAAQADPDRPEDLDTEGEDHALDSVRYACLSRPYAAPLPPEMVPLVDRYAVPFRPRRQTKGWAA